MEENSIIKIDGSHKEGGGQIVRTALALSIITGKAFEVDNIRKGRCSSGLKNQHMYCIKALQQLSSSKAEGAELGSESLKFFPGKFNPKSISIDIETAGSITLLLQSLMIPCMLGSGTTKFRITGGTDVKWSMPVDYFSEIVLPQMRRYADIDFRLEKRGYYPKGGGVVELKVKPRYTIDNLKDAAQVNLTEQGTLMQIKGVSHASQSLQKAMVAERQAESANNILKSLECPVNIRTEYHDSLSDGSAITLWSVFSINEDDLDISNPIRIGADSLGERGKRAEDVGKEAADRLINEINYKAPVDEYLADNMIPLLALFGGKIKVAKISSHALTNIYVVEKFLDVKFNIDKEKRIISVNLPR